MVTLRLPLLGPTRLVVAVHFRGLEDPKAQSGRSDLRDDLPHRVLRRHASTYGCLLGPSAFAAGARGHVYPSAMDVTGCTSQIVGIRLFKLGGPRRCPGLWGAAKKSAPEMGTGIGGAEKAGGKAGNLGP